MKWTLILLVLASCCGPQKPKTYTPPPSLTSAKHAVADAKDMLSRAQLSNRDINKLINELENLKK